MAAIDHAWLMQLPEGEELVGKHRYMRDILAAVSDPSDGPELLTLVVDARASQTQLLQTATFGQNPRRKMLARTYAHQHVSNCLTLLFDS